MKPLAGDVTQTRKTLRRLRRLLAAAAVIFAFAVAPATVRSSEPPVVAAASDLQFALPEIAQAFKDETGHDVVLTFGSSGNFARKIRQGAPFELYLSADEALVLELDSDGFTRDAGRVYAVGRIVLMVPHGSPLHADGSLADLRAALRDGRLARFAIANPEHAPYGRRAAEALRHAGLWEAIRPKLVFGENVAQAAQFATSPDADGGLVAHALVRSPTLAALGSFALVPEHWHSPLRQRMVLLAGAGPVAERFYAYLQDDAARRILRSYGFATPGE